MADPKPLSINFPSELPVKTLEEHHPEYDADKIRKYGAVYAGGTAFNEVKKDLLVKREIEKGILPGGAGNKHWENRLEKAWYIPRGPGVIDAFIAAIFKNDLKLKVNGGSAESKEYWEGLNEDCDGNGTNISKLARDVCREVLLHKRSYIGFDFPHAVGHPSVPATMAAHWRLINAVYADDWENDKDGKMLWLRTACKRKVRGNPWEQPTEVVQCWRYITPDQIFEYEAAGDDADKTRKAKGKSLPHSFGALPVFPVRASSEMWIMERAYDILVALFNREVSITWALDQLAYSLLLLKLEDPESVSKVVAAEVAALKLRTTENAEIISPPAGISKPLFDDAERLKQALYEVIQSLAMNAAAAQTQNARQSAQAKEIDRSPMQALLTSFTWPIRDTFTAAINALKIYRKEENLDIEIEGMDVFDATIADLAPEPAKKPAPDSAHEPVNV